MANESPQFESHNQQGDTTHHNGTVGTTYIAIPAVADPDLVVSKVLIIFRERPENEKTDELHVSFDDEVNFLPMIAGSILDEPVHGNRTQIHIKSNNAGAPPQYYIKLDREPKV